jgi:hypothetical protein
MATPIQKQDVLERLTFAERRLSEFLTLNAGDLAGADGSVRQQLLQEFFFHLIGAADLAAQLVNDSKSLGLDTEDVSVLAVCRALPSSDPLAVSLLALYARVRGQPVPADPYSDDAYVFRAYNYRNQVTHRRRNPFLFRVGGGAATCLYLDPRDARTIASVTPA